VLHEDWSPLDHFTVVPFFPFFLNGIDDWVGREPARPAGASEQGVLAGAPRYQHHGELWLGGEEGCALSNMSTGELEQRGAETGLVMEVNDDVKNVD
jgi:hypothetical protein